MKGVSRKSKSMTILKHLCTYFEERIEKKIETTFMSLYTYLKINWHQFKVENAANYFIVSVDNTEV